MGNAKPLGAPSLGLRLAGFVSMAGIVGVNAMGVVDHDTKSGMGCGAHWPLCHGALIPAFSNEAVIIEYVHRLLTLGFTIALVVFLFDALRRYRTERLWKYLSRLLTGLLVVETIICTAGVLWAVPNAIMAWLMPVGLAAQALLWLMVRRNVRTRPLGKEGEAGRLHASTISLAALALFGYLYLGAWISYAGPAGLTRGLMVVAGILLALFGLAWIVRDRQAGVAIPYMAWPFLAAPFVVRFSRTTIMGDLAVYVWLSWLTGMFALRVMAGLRGPGTRVVESQSVGDASSA
ncbi:hypothetical protein [Sulfobacillus harzensis]|uniref:Cytochrome c oxidase assembly protein subunit 15 n=1 Tax=Sulfobacillus harzensis TaxID=2729629 RepID=A0A7Y0L7D1_9FIRM|nr:hypothetical protein [Sulfobacillus harzensis]NMP24373.1 hypothetical protein [Sulfobacillus harzensis]